MVASTEINPLIGKMHRTDLLINNLYVRLAKFELHTKIGRVPKSVSSQHRISYKTKILDTNLNN